ncbi:MAG: tRNA-binding protein [Crocinitomix sp.]|nr:tRNA-binding protein [Crocinitomix sp.]
MPKAEITWADFAKLDIRTGTIQEAVVLEKARVPAYQLKVNFGELGIKKTSAQITERYKPADLNGKQVLAVVNFPPKQIAKFMSECLILGAVEGDDIILVQPDSPIKNGLPIG